MINLYECDVMSYQRKPVDIVKVKFLVKAESLRREPSKHGPEKRKKDHWKTSIRTPQDDDRKCFKMFLTWPLVLRVYHFINRATVSFSSRNENFLEGTGRKEKVCSKSFLSPDMLDCCATGALKRNKSERIRRLPEKRDARREQANQRRVCGHESLRCQDNGRADVDGQDVAFSRRIERKKKNKIKKKESNVVKLSYRAPDIVKTL